VVERTAFHDCPNLTEILVEPLNSVFSSVDGVLFNKNQTKLIQYPAGKSGAYRILPSVTALEEAAFYSCAGLTSITIPNSVTSISEMAFTGCANLVDIAFSKSTVTIGNGAFEGCAGLTNISIPDSVNRIGDKAFYFCRNLGTLTIGKNVTSIGDQAFARCHDLMAVYFEGNAPSARPMSFFGAAKATIYYRRGTTGWTGTFASCPTESTASGFDVTQSRAM
jgi:hypothetical protein